MQRGLALLGGEAEAFQSSPVTEDRCNLRTVNDADIILAVSILTGH